MSRAAEIWAQLSGRVSDRPRSTLFGRTHAWLLRRSRGRLGKRFLGIEVLVLRTTGRRSGSPRESPMFFVEHGDGFAVVASNAAAEKPPSWWLNLRAHPDAEALVAGSWRPVRGRLATATEAAALWPRLDEIYSGYEHYREITTRELPVIVLEPRLR
jgi:deazaflavin-dependent oxidoreductase (nitroreductase family)